MSEVINSFEYVNLNEIDPDNAFKPLDEAVYNLKLLKMTSKVAKSGKNYLSVQVAVVDDPKFSGRQLFSVMFPNPMTLKILRRIADNTGVKQNPDAPFDAWLEEMNLVQPVVKAPVIKHEDREFVKGVDKDRPTGEPRSLKADGTVNEVNSVRWIEVRPAN